MTGGAGALAGWRVLDLSQGIAGPYCAFLLRHNGVEVGKKDYMGAY